jgi:hypothetical protein
MGVKYPLEFDLLPNRIEKGNQWLRLRLKNIGVKKMQYVDIQLNSLDSLNLNPLGTGQFVTVLDPGEEKILPFQVSSYSTGDLYFSLQGWIDEELFNFESPPVRITIGDAPADLRSLTVISDNYPLLKSTLKCDANVLGLAESSGLQLEFWAHSPNGDFENLAKIETKELKDGEEASYSTEITPEEKGLYSVHAFLYNNGKRIGHEKAAIYVKDK